ncbi:MAG: hypothetical protein EAZ36_05080 [Verrucomicrobia bacterium]|nr:MAG: hypothetical protein EAZ36_05080 [Verrucomicrobiota bacterium]
MHLGQGELETLIASAFFMGQILWLDRKEFTKNRCSRVTLTMFTIQALVCGALLLGLAPKHAFADALTAPWTSMAWTLRTLALTLICTVGAYSLMNAWQPKIPATEAGLVYCAEPIFGSVFALFLPAILSAWTLIYYPNETATWTLLVGGILITAANAVMQLNPTKASADSSSVSPKLPGNR